MKNNYNYNNLSYAEQLKYVKVPKFQRSLVWNKQKKLDLLKTLHKNFPFGALLVSPVNGNKQAYRLLDGQQRLSTIRDFEQHRLSYWKELNKHEYIEMLNRINEVLLTNHLNKINEKQFDQILDDDFEVADWTDSLESEDSHPVDRKRIRNLIGEFKDVINDYIHLNTLLIPVIEFTGDEADLPEVYENLNRGGVPLTKYEVLNASWSDEKIKIPSHFELGDTILNSVKEYYNQLKNDGSFDIENFSEDEITMNREINLAEFARSIGKLVVNRMPSLLSETPKLVNEMGFGLLGIITNTDNKKIATIHNKNSEIQANVVEILTQLDKLAKVINAPFDELLKQNIAFGKHKKAKKNQYLNGISTTFKILSYFAALWDRDDSYIQSSMKNIPSYYVYDYVAMAWNAHGDQRLFSYYRSNSKRNYTKPIPENEFKTVFYNWISDNPGIKKRFSKEIQTLITIHANRTYLANGLSASEDYEFEHVIPKARILENDAGPSVVHLSSLGNGMFLPKSLNNSKSSKTLYEFNKDADTVDYRLLRKQSDYFTESQFETIFHKLDEKQFENVNNFIDNRAYKMADQIVAGLNPNNDFFHKISANHTQQDHLKRD
ncbi:DUF262 domain-containing protein [Lactobacillus sp. Sy-1]|uniref:DUF262 domain-containing protein n=1 Tax=Lactobacillus sp. Sy-1 TaxID=2109645 RepID=UPI001C56996A|nr:DUF262 domain-containing protein [Lactobacillus sp. Sy-1]MBW1605043.1 DUF262 domain-containing protein [Lactobacillus sp. Sy-1]